MQSNHSFSLTCLGFLHRGRCGISGGNSLLSPPVLRSKQFYDTGTSVFEVHKRQTCVLEPNRLLESPLERYDWLGKGSCFRYSVVPFLF